jgi:hypothetical protein
MSDLSTHHFDPVEYGKLIQAVDDLRAKVDGMDADLKKLVELANRSSGGLWVGMTIASFLGGLLTFFGTLLFGQK